MSYLDTILHPHHISLLSNQHSLQSLFHQFQDRIDPYCEIDGAHIRSSVNSPRFNVSETETSFILEGELPGLADKKAISVEWMQNQVLIIRGNIAPGAAETLIDPFEDGLKNDAAVAVPEYAKSQKTLSRAQLDAELDKPAYAGPRKMLRERHIGDFQRSFTFPVEVAADSMEASLANGLLTLVVLKVTGAATGGKRIQVL